MDITFILNVYEACYKAVPTVYYCNILGIHNALIYRIQ